MSNKNISPEVMAKVQKELADLRARKQQIELALKEPLGREYTEEELEKENVALQNRIDAIVKDYGLE